MAERIDKAGIAFPTTVTLVDTGERRYPREGDIYFWCHPRKGYAVSGPWRADDEDVQWSDTRIGPEYFAIYKVQTDNA